MDAVINVIRSELYRLGFSPKEKEIATMGGRKIWVVFSNQNNYSFSVQGCSQREAWESARQLVAQMRNGAAEPQMILPFPEVYPSYNRAA
jgi:hypothetical protein